MRAALILLGLGSLVPGVAGGQWRLGADIGTSTFWGTSQDTSGTTREGSFRPQRPTTLTLRVERRITRVTLGLALSYSNAALVLQTDGPSIFEDGVLMQVQAAPEIAVAAAQLSTGASLAIHAGPLVEFWTLEGEEERVRLGGQVGLSLQFPLGRRLASAVNARVGVTPSLFKAGELPSEFERRPSWRRGVSLGLRYRL